MQRTLASRDAMERLRGVLVGYNGPSTSVVASGGSAAIRPGTVVEPESQAARFGKFHLRGRAPAPRLPYRTAHAVSTAISSGQFASFQRCTTRRRV
ncbi:hypothetical protein BH23GEM3_BH23GEM3_09480 [soil metagenome]